MRCRFVTLLALLVALLFAPPAIAQPPAAAKRAQVEAKMGEIRGRMLRDQVGLSEVKARNVEAILQRHRNERLDLRQKLLAHQRKIAELLRQDSDDQSAYTREIQGMRTSQRQLQALRETEIDELQKVLTPKEQARLGVAMRQMRRRMNQAAQGYRGAGPGPH